MHLFVVAPAFDLPITAYSLVSFYIDFSPKKVTFCCGFILLVLHLLGCCVIPKFPIMILLKLNFVSKHAVMLLYMLDLSLRSSVKMESI